MPGLKKSPGLADVDVCVGAHKAGSSALRSAYNRGTWTYDGLPAQRVNSMDFNRYPEYPLDKSGALPVAGAYPDSASEDSDSAETPVHEGFENRITIPYPTQQRSLNFEESGLPPTPPTLHNSDDSQDAAHDEDGSQTIFADGVRNALQSKQSGHSVTPVNAASPPTPDPSPPATTVEPPPMEQRQKPDFLQPLIAESVSAHHLRQVSSSKAESFTTAQEGAPESNLASPVYVPEDDKLPEHWLDSTRELQMATAGLGSMTVAETPIVKDSEQDGGAITPRRRSRRISKHDSPPQTARTDSDWEKHISYVSGPDELEEYQNLANGETANEEQEEAKGLGLSGAGLRQSDIQRSAEDVNNMVYKRIQEENVKRHSVVSSGSGAITVGIILPADSTPRTLKRQTKCLSLRESTISGGSRRNSWMDSPEPRLLGPRKVRGSVDRAKKLEASPVLESSIRQVSSPARLGPDASNMTALTYASLQDSPSMRKSGGSRLRPETEHKLRHLSYGDRLSNNTSIRRTSLHGSPKALANGFEIFREPEYPSRRLSGIERAAGENMTNVGIKRSSTEGAKPSRVLTKPRGVIPSVVSDTPDEMLERSPTTGRLRRFSRGERLENNDSVRRTSMDHEKALKIAPDLPMKANETQRPSLPSTKERASFQSTSDRAVLPSSPRKSMDARFLHPTTTPMSTSQLSDRTEVELCEASGVRIYPHNNDSLLVVQHGSRPVSKGKTSNLDGYDTVEDQLQGLGKPIFAAQVEPPTPTLRNQDPINNLDSPLTNPRTAPEPPTFIFIPPTPNQELERTPSDAERKEGTLEAEVNLPQRRLTLLQRARRYSDSLFSRTGGYRRPRRPGPEERDTYLSPMWRPTRLFDDYGDDYYSDSDDEDDFEAAGALPAGGDTSDVEDDAKRKGLLPRSMSKRLPGFRGTGGFLVGNSLGLDRHGTNNRRHYVSTSTKVLSKRQSEELLKNIASRNSAGSHSASPASQESLRRMVKARTISVPFSGGKRAQWVGTRRLRSKMKAMRLAREERAAEKRREKLREQIGPRVVQSNAEGGRNQEWGG